MRQSFLRRGGWMHQLRPVRQNSVDFADDRIRERGVEGRTIPDEKACLPLARRFRRYRVRESGFAGAAAPSDIH